MPETSVSFHPDAVAEVEAAWAWYAGQNTQAAQAFLSEFDHAVAQILELPERWPRFRSGTRQYVCPRFPFSLVYESRDNEV